MGQGSDPIEPGNGLLRSLPEAELQRLWPMLERVELTPRAVLLVPGRPIGHVHFVESGVVCMIATLADGNQIEVGSVGFEGFVGVPVALGVRSPAFEGFVRSGGSALRLTADGLRRASIEIPSLRSAVLRFVECFQMQVSQLAACNGRHVIGQRLARWILMNDERMRGERFAVTHELLATMLGVRRPGITEALGTLQRAGLVRHRGGALQVTDRDGLSDAACECHRLVRQRYDAVLRRRA